ncbi:hypothetical protein [Streptomyces sp. NPDC059247]|uniref:hypothetical protein n=1 Tax=Streptomyces sp. NPDC059247 TaxID=3346790 RepID=UPI0036973536
MLIPARAAMSDIRRAAVPFSAMRLMTARMVRSRTSAPLGWRFLSVGTRAVGREAAPLPMGPEASDARCARSETLGPLDGIPYTTKDSYGAAVIDAPDRPHGRVDAHGHSTCRHAIDGASLRSPNGPEPARPATRVHLTAPGLKEEDSPRM